MLSPLRKKKQDRITALYVACGGKGEYELVGQRTPQQKDVTSCGVFCLIVLAHLLEVKALPMGLAPFQVANARAWLECILRSGKPPPCHGLTRA